MEKITDKIAALPKDGTFFSLEFFPPKTDAGQEHLQARLSRMARALRPTFVNVTWGAGGSTASKSLELAELCQRQLNLTTCLHLTCTNMEKGLLDRTLAAAKDIGVRNILALRGDPPRRYEYGLDETPQDQNGDFVWAADLVRYIRKEYGDYFCIGVAGYPEGHSDESNPEVGSQTVEQDLPYLVEKCQAGADFIMTQLFYDIDAYTSYEKRVKEFQDGVLASLPIIPGLMPIQNFQALKRIAKLSHASLPPDLLKQLEDHRSNDEEIKRIGVEYITSLVQQIKKLPASHSRGFHFYTLNLEKSVSYIVERCKLIPELTAADYLDGPAIDDGDGPVNGNVPTISINNASEKRRPSTRRPSSPHNHTMDDGSTVSSNPPSRATTLKISEGIGSLGREATWDDYPNGRFGDARSPAFGEIDGYGPSIHMSPASARTRWGFPESAEDIQQLFLRHIRGEVDVLPWTEGPLNDETKVIEKELCALIERGWFSIASQPAIDATSSNDPIFGWGPRGGFVFQKAFVELFVPSKDWHEKLRPQLIKNKGKVSWYASPCALPKPAQANGEGQTELKEFESGEEAGSANSVTWGVFAGKEIASPTIIEEMSFKAWVEEAFNLWAEWERCYPAGKTREFLRQRREDSYLVNVIGHTFKQPGELWEILLAA